MISYRKVIVLQDIVTNTYLKEYYWRDDSLHSYDIKEAREFEDIEELMSKIEEFKKGDEQESSTNEFTIGKFRIVELLIIEDKDN